MSESVPAPVFTVRSVGLGALLSLCIALGTPYGNMVIRGSTMALDFSTAGAIWLAIALSLVGSVWMILHLAYQYGGINLASWFFGGGVRAPFDYIATKLNTPTTVSWEGWAHTGIGGAVMALLMLARPLSV